MEAKKRINPFVPIYRAVNNGSNPEKMQLKRISDYLLSGYGLQAHNQNRSTCDHSGSRPCGNSSRSGI